MAESVKTKHHPFRKLIQKLEINRAEIARRYGCSTNFVYDCLGGKYSMPQRLQELMQVIIVERTAHLRGVLSEVEGFEVVERARSYEREKLEVAAQVGSLSGD